MKRRHGNATGSIAARVAARDWESAGAALDARGHAVLPGLLAAGECAALAALYEDERQFRAHIVMARHGFGLGDYKYFRYPLPPLVAALREALYPRLAPVARRWAPAIGLNPASADRLQDFLRICHAAGQTRPTPLLLRYDRDGYNCLHQDIYGEIVFPLQVTVLLSRPGRDFSGGEFLLVEQRPRAQSRVNLRHGVSRITRGTRLALGVIFHDSR
jgi:hypothetical protein